MRAATQSRRPNHRAYLVSVKGKDKTPFYQFLTDKKANPAPGGEIGWNFAKFLVDKNGKVIARFGSSVKPESPELISAIECTSMFLANGEPHRRPA